MLTQILYLICLILNPVFVKVINPPSPSLRFSLYREKEKKELVIFIYNKTYAFIIPFQYLFVYSDIDLCSFKFFLMFTFLSITIEFCLIKKL